MTTKTYGPASTLTNTELNELQDDYIDGAMTPWTLVGSSSFWARSNANRYPGTGPPHLTGHHSIDALGGLGAAYLAAADFPDSHNDTLRALQFRIIAIVVTNAIPITSLLASLSLRMTVGLTLETNPGTGVQRYAMASELGTITFPSINQTLATLRYDGAAFTLPASGLYTLELLFNASSDTGQGAMVHGYLQRRAI